jgi:hypothetical protein
MDKRTLLGFLSAVLILGAGVARADISMGDRDRDDDRDCPGRECRPPTKTTCFNLVCYFDDEKNPHGFKSCKAAAKFNKRVTVDGGEVQDDSNLGDNPQFEVTCDNKILFNNSARRFTDLLGTRIQGETGPHPSISIPRGELHSGSDGRSGDHISPAVLELDTGNQLLRTRGQCYIWTGAP